MSWKKFFYYTTVGLACFTVVHFVGISGLHAWNRIILGMPIGLITGYAELAIFSTTGMASAWLAGKTYTNILKKESPKNEFP